jgi:hypothetical protein
MLRAAWIVLGLAWLAAGARPDAAGSGPGARAASASAAAHARGRLLRGLAPVGERARWAVAESSEESESDPDPSLPACPTGLARAPLPWTGIAPGRLAPAPPASWAGRTKPLRC